MAYSLGFPFVQFVLDPTNAQCQLGFPNNQKGSQNHIKYTLRKVICSHPDQVITNSAHIHNSGITEVATHQKYQVPPPTFWIERSTQPVHVHTYGPFVCLFFQDLLLSLLLLLLLLLLLFMVGSSTCLARAFSTIPPPATPSLIEGNN